MFFMYVDESGDPGLNGTRHYILSGIVLPVQEWRNYLTALVDIRRYIKRRFGFPMRVELKGSKLINPRGDRLYGSLSRRQRVMLYQDTLQMITVRMPSLRIINVHVDKHKPRYSSTLTDIEKNAWSALIQRFNTYLLRNANRSYGLLFTDETNEIKLRRLLRRMRVFNYVPSHFGGYYPAPVVQLAEDPIVRSSSHSYFIQIADLVAHALYRKLYPKGSYRCYNVDRLFDILAPLLHIPASKRDPFGYGIVHL